MIKRHLFTLHFLPLLVLGCAKPEGEVDDPINDGPPSSGDEVDELPGEPEDPPLPLPSGYCLIKEEPPHEGIRHQCGGSISMSITGDALGYPVDENIYVDFGAFVPGDAYEQARVAACCGEYDFEQLASNQPEYWRNCLYDAVQQFCGALPYYLWDMAAAAKANDELVVADQLNKLGNDLSTGGTQYECIDSLWAGGPVEDFNLIMDHSWNAAYDISVNIDLLEVFDLSLPEDPADWMTCKSIYENDESVVPDIQPGPIWDQFGVDAGWLKLSGQELELTAVPDTSSELLVGYDTSGNVILGALQLHGGVLRVAGLTFERWRVATLRSVATRELDDGSLEIPAGSLTFVGAVVIDGETISVAARNASALVLRESARGWTIDPFSLVYTPETGDAWTLDSSELLFELR